MSFMYLCFPAPEKGDFCPHKKAWTEKGMGTQDPLNQVQMSSSIIKTYPPFSSLFILPISQVYWKDGGGEAK